MAQPNDRVGVIDRPGAESGFAPAAKSNSVATRAVERLFSRRFDRQICAGATTERGRAFALHVTRLTAIAQREKLASQLSAVVIDARCGRVHMSPRLPLDRSAVATAAGVIGQIMARLQAAGPVDPRGVARLRMLMSRARGPLYRYGRGDLTAELRHVLTLL